MLKFKGLRVKVFKVEGLGLGVRVRGEGFGFETKMQWSPLIIILCIGCCFLFEEEGRHLFVTIVSR